MTKAIPFDYTIFEQMQDPEFAEIYVKLSLEEGNEEADGDSDFLRASKQYAQSQRLAGYELVLPETATETLKTALAVSFDAYVTALRDIVNSPSIRHTDL